MAIQFNCPYCTAGIRVPDSAAGKQGTCPKCETKLIVPKIGPAAETSSPPAESPAIRSKNPPVPKSTPPKSQNAAKPADHPTSPPAVPEESAPEFPALQIGDPEIAAEPSLARVVRQRAKRKGTNPLIPIALFGVVLGVLLFWMWKSSSQLEGQLTAVRLEEFAIPPGQIDRSTFELPADEAEAIWEELKKHPPAGVLVRDWFDMQFQPDEKGLQVLIRKTSATEVFRVKTNAAPALRQLIHEHAEELLKRQQEEFQKAAKRFLEDWRTAQEKDGPLETGGYRDSLGFNRLTGPRGYGLEAQVGARAYRCVHEDKNGDLYFLLPRKTEKFVLRGRRFEDGKTLIAGSLTVEVQNPSSDAAPTKSPDPAETAPAPDPPMNSPESKTEMPEAN